MALHTELAFYIIINANNKQTSPKSSVAEYFNTDFSFIFCQSNFFKEMEYLNYIKIQIFGFTFP